VTRNHYDWQPIDTAPKDGTPVECLWPGWGQPVGGLHQGVCVFKRGLVRAREAGGTRNLVDRGGVQEPYGEAANALATGN
jgi:hypothetical protein